MTPPTSPMSPALEKVRMAETLVMSALDALAEAEQLAEGQVTREIVRLAEADATALAGRLASLALRLERPRDGAA